MEACLTIILPQILDQDFVKFSLHHLRELWSSRFSQKNIGVYWWFIIKQFYNNLKKDKAIINLFASLINDFKYNLCIKESLQILAVFEINLPDGSI